MMTSHFKQLQDRPRSSNRSYRTIQRTS